MIELRSVTKKFNVGTPDETTLFDNFQLHVGKGEFVSIVGSNGSGKTTLLNILCRVPLPVDGGSVLLNGKDITKLSEHHRARYIAGIFQDPQKGSEPRVHIGEYGSF